MLTDAGDDAGTPAADGPSRAREPSTTRPGSTWPGPIAAARRRGPAAAAVAAAGADAPTAAPLRRPPRRPRPAAAGRHLDRLVADQRLGDRGAGARRVRRAGPQIVGREVAAHCHAGGLRRRRLVGAHRLHGLGHPDADARPTVVRRLNEELGDGTVHVIDVPGRTAPSWKQGPRSVRDGRGPRDTYG